MHSVFHHCWECSGYGCLQNLANATNTPVNGVLNYIATVMGDAVRGVFKTLANIRNQMRCRKGQHLLHYWHLPRMMVFDSLRILTLVRVLQ